MQSFCLNTWNATDRTLSFKVWGVLGFGFGRFRGVRVVLAFVLLEHGMPQRGYILLRFRCVLGFEVFGVSGWGRADLRAA